MKVAHARGLRSSLRSPSNNQFLGHSASHSERDATSRKIYLTARPEGKYAKPLPHILAFLVMRNLIEANVPTGRPSSPLQSYRFTSGESLETKQLVSNFWVAQRRIHTWVIAAHEEWIILNLKFVHQLSESLAKPFSASSAKNWNTPQY